MSEQLNHRFKAFLILLGVCLVLGTPLVLAYTFSITAAFFID